MKSLLVRVGALGGLFLLGWIAIAQAQRGGEPVEGRSTADSTAVASDYRSPSPSSKQRNVNPLRAPASAPPSSDIPDAEPDLGRPTADPFGLHNQYPVKPTSAEEPASAGPNLVPIEAPVRPENRYSAPPPAEAAVSAEREPAPFQADPYAMPANITPMSPPGGFAERAPTDAEGTGRPGNPQLEGIQSPQLTVHKVAPKEIQVGKPAAFRVVVRNIGQVPACDVEVRDQVPQGTRLLKTEPQAKAGVGGELTWTLGTLQPGEEAAVEMQLMPTTEGEIGSVAAVRFGAEATARSIATRPQLVLETAAPEKVLIGDQLTLSIVVSNPGTGVASGVVLEERIPAGLHHPAGNELEYTVGDLKPGESRKLELPLVADRAGRIVNLLTARGDGDLRVENKRGLEVIAPQLDVAVAGPKRRYLERQATYQLSVANSGTAPAEQVELVASLPAGLKFVSANNAGYYEEATRSVHWRLEKLPAQEVGSVELVTLPVEAGEHAIRLRGTAEKGLVAEKEQPVLVEGIAAILFQVADRVDPIGVGGETAYEIRVMNQGSKAAANVQLAVLLPPELQPVSAEGPARHAVEGNHVFFEGLAQLAPKAETVYRVRAKALRPGDLRVNMQLKSDDMQSPVTKQESTRVYAEE
ncbi:MAG: DUF11 domain-containing protein [Pirellulales bacterium]|nr:DUF11 domain-containing protein [Pirellulales bacterium]